MGPIKFIKECNLIELFDDIDEDLRLDDTTPLEFDCFSTDDDILEYLGAHSKLPKSNEKRKPNYILNEYAYFGQVVNFNEVFQVQQGDDDTGDIQGLEEFPSLLHKKDELTFPAKELVDVNIGTSDAQRLVKVGVALPIPQQERYKNKFIENQKKFAWSYADMSSLDPSFVMHNLPLKEGAKPIKQRPRKMHPSKTLLVKKEIEKYLNVGFIEPIDYSEWMANIVLVTKTTREIRICTNFHDINNACTKDDFPMPNIDMIVDSIASHDTLSFMDGFSRYNPILINPIDQYKTAFTTPWGNFCWKVIPFKLKNAGATCQRAMVSMFHEHIHKSVEVYVDDILVKSKQGQDHIELFEEVFQILKRYKPRLKPQKSAFGVTSGKLLGFMVSKRGIEVDSKKVKAIVSMSTPRNLKQLRSLQGKINSIRRFISQLGDKCRPFTYLLKKDASLYGMKSVKKHLRI